MNKNHNILFIIIWSIVFLCQVCHSQPFDHSRIWNSWTDYTRDAYLKGFDEGRFEESLEIIMSLTNPLNPVPDSILAKIKKINDKTHIYFPLESIRDVMTDLYQDPANSFISFISMIYISKDKLKGEPINKRLEQERKSVYQVSKYLQDTNK